MDQTRRAARVWVRQQTRIERRRAGPVVGLALLGVALAVVQAACVAAVLGAALHRRAPHAAPLLGFAVSAIGRAACASLAETMAQRLGARVRGRLRAEVVARVLRVGPALLRGRHSAELAAIATDRIETLDGLFRTWLPASLLAIAGPILVAAALAFVAPADAAILAGAGLLVPFAMALSGLGAAAATRNQFTALTRLQTRFVDRVRGITTLVIANQAENEATRLAAAADELRVRTMRVLRIAFLSSAALDCAAAAALVIIALRHGWAGDLLASHRTVPAFFALLLVPEFFAPLRAFAAAYAERMHAVAAAEALTGLPDCPPMPVAGPVRTVAARGIAIAFEDVRFSWDPTRRPALDGVSFRVPAGETLVLTGPSGAGKSTAIEILLGFAHPDGGRVTLNGSDLASIVPQALARLTSWIGQRPVLFAGTLRENICFARPDATDEELREAVRAARMDGVADGLPLGLDTVVGEGGHGLSGGQAQRVAIARAFLRNAPLLLLDEPTSHLDPVTEREILDCLRVLAAGRTVIMAGHSRAVHGFGGRQIELRHGRVLDPAAGADMAALP